MYKIIFIYLVFMAVNTNGWPWERQGKYFSQRKHDRGKLCATTYEMWPKNVCGTDGYDYHNLHYFRCIQTTEYGKRVNLQLSNEWRCWIWEQHGIKTSTLCYVSEFQIDSIWTEWLLKFVWILLQIMLITYAIMFLCLYNRRAIQAAWIKYRKEKCPESNECILLA